MRLQHARLELVTFHAGFLPEEPDDPERAKLIGRLRTYCEVFADQGVRLGLETGQETAHTLAGVLADLDHPAVGVNFDPANMILYGMGDPVAALRTLRDHVRQIHVKDALPSSRTGEWGSEVRAGTGGVDWPAFFGVARSIRNATPSSRATPKKARQSTRPVPARTSLPHSPARALGSASLTWIWRT